MSNELRGLDAWIEGRSDTSNPRSPYYTGSEFEDWHCMSCGAEFSDEDKLVAENGEGHCPQCGSYDILVAVDGDEPDPDLYRDEERFDDEPDWAHR